MSPDPIDDLFELYAMGLLEPAERERIDDLLRAGDPDAQARLRKALETNTLILAGLPDQPAPSRGLRGRILAAAGHEQPKWGRHLAWAALCASLLAALVYTSWRQQDLDDQLAATRDSLQKSQSTLQLREAALDFLRAPDTRLLKAADSEPARPVAKVFVNSAQGVLLMAANLPALDPGRTYEMWIVPKAGPPKPAGLFLPAGDGSAVHLQSGPVDLAAAAAVAITNEPAGGSPSPTTNPFLITPVGD
jgi:hypothetical protein